MAYLDSRPASPAAALAELLAGNERFVTGTRLHPHQDVAHRAAVAAAQRPFAVVFGCSDSRLAAEIIFDRGLGDLFVVRTAGHIIGVEVTASIEYGVAVLGAPLVVVLGHDSCGAIQATRAAMTGTRLPGRELGTIAERVTPSIWLANARQVTDHDEVGRIHVRRTVETLTRPGTELGEAVAAGRCDVVGMFYRLAEGRVSVLVAEPAQEQTPAEPARE